MVYFDEQTFESAASLAEGEYEYCTFKDCDLANMDFQEYKFVECEFVNCNLSNANINQTYLQDVIFNNCKMLGLSFDQCNPFGFAAKFEHCSLDHSTFFQVKLSQSSFKDCHMHEVDFTEAVMTGMVVTNCDLLNAHFENTNLEKADFTSSTNYSINPEINKLKGARFSLPDVVGLLDKYGIKVN